MKRELIPSRTRRWTFGLYALALLLFLQPFAETASTVWPFRFGEVGWRFAAVGILYTMLPTLLFALLVAAIAAYLLGHRTALRVDGVIAMVLGVGILLLTVGFVLDAVQLRRIVRPEAKGGYDLTVIKALVTAALALVGCAMLGVATFRSGRRLVPPGGDRRRARGGEGLLVGQQPRPPA